MDYEMMFKKLAEQIRKETKWARESAEETKNYERPVMNRKFKGMNPYDQEQAINNYGKAVYDRGVKFGYETVLRMVEELEKHGDF